MKLKYSEAFSLEGETTLITGGGSGIGLAIAGAMIQRSEAAARSPVSILVNNAGKHLTKPASNCGRQNFPDRVS